MSRRFVSLLYLALAVPFGIASALGLAACCARVERCTCTVCRRKRTAIAAVYRPRLMTVAPQRPLVQYALSFAVRPPPAFLLANP